MMKIVERNWYFLLVGLRNNKFNKWKEFFLIERCKIQFDNENKSDTILTTRAIITVWQIQVCLFWSALDLLASTIFNLRMLFLKGILNKHNFSAEKANYSKTSLFCYNKTKRVPSWYEFVHLTSRLIEL